MQLLFKYFEKICKNKKNIKLVPWHRNDFMELHVEEMF